MASNAISKASHHARSISLPSRPHPISDQFEEQLCRLRSSQAASTSSSSLSHSLSSLKDLYHCVDELLQLPLNQQALSRSLHGQWVEEVLDGSLRLLDICGTSRDVLQLSKESLKDIQSVLRRRCSGELTIAKEVVEYQNTRKSAQKVVKKCLKNINEVDTNDEANAIVSMLKDVEAVSLDVFKSLLSNISGSKLSKKSSWSVLSKLIHKSVDKEAPAPSSEFDAVDASVDSLCQKKESGINMSQVEVLRSQMMKLESEIQDLDESLECLSRHLVKTRATLLNILSN